MMKQIRIRFNQIECVEMKIYGEQEKENEYENEWRRRTYWWMVEWSIEWERRINHGEDGCLDV